MAPFKAGLIGTRKICDIYLKNCVRFLEPSIAVFGSLNPTESQQKAARFGVPRIVHQDEIINDPNIDCILNLTIPAAHAEVSMWALHADKHVYSEKLFAANCADAQSILYLAQDKNLLVGNAPDTFLGGCWQIVRRMIDTGVIGDVTGCMAFIGTHGVERHHPNPDFYYQEGGGPLLDLGLYYLIVMVF